MKRASNFAEYLRPEDKLHASVVRYIRYRYPGALVHHSPNEGKRGPYQRYLVKCMSVNAGFPDLLVFYRGRMVAIELKIRPNKLSALQAGWIEHLQQYMPVTVAYSVEEVIDFLDKNL